jgi:hypothetical protein
MIGFAFTSPSAVVTHLVSTCQESNIRSNIAVISDRYCPVSMNGEVASDPTICTNAERPCIMNRPDNFGIFPDLIADGTKKIPLCRKEPGSGQKYD